jgi:23S rRNA (uracil1939-C5)-methyltransferase
MTAGKATEWAPAVFRRETRLVADCVDRGAVGGQGHLAAWTGGTGTMSERGDEETTAAAGPSDGEHPARADVRAATGRQRRPGRARERVSGSRPGGDRLETTIERIVPGGFGLAHGGGRTLFVTLAAPGDRVRVEIERTQGVVGFARIVEMLEPSPVRVPPPYPHLADCGGGDFQHLAYEAQLAAKVEIVRDCLRRIARIEAPADVPMIASPQRWHYRSRAEWHHDPERGTLGYLAQGSHRVCDVVEDPIVVPALADALRALRQRLEAGRLPEEAREFRAAAGDEAVSFAPPLDSAEPLEIVSTVAGERYASDADCFFQVNPGVLPALIEEALRFASPVAGDGVDSQGVGRPAIDLYCGVGLFTVPLARRFGRVVGVESHPRSAAFAARNATDAGLERVRIETMPVDRWLGQRWRSYGRTPFLLLDPPRTGVDAATLQGILRLRPARIAYVSCDPATLARDLRALLAAGHQLERVAAFDMFPQTHHVEVVAHLVQRM